ncbi:hypothetical protein TrCOL_g7787 [Triparma columacea]|uniref:Uncharacterized protein n=1 Tax=Triparma columacea TaxID=722753 RepID=A0A9W7LDB4_9STRA|nr:hypothetical protein TrCOL_g7787 [Triparma columacea]
MAVDLSKLSVVYSLLYIPYLCKPTYARLLNYLEKRVGSPLISTLLPQTYLFQALTLLLLTTVVDLEGDGGLLYFTAINWARELSLAVGDWMLTIAVIRFLRGSQNCTTSSINVSMAESSRLRSLGSFVGSLLTLLVYAILGDDGSNGVPKGVMVLCFVIAAACSGGGAVVVMRDYRDRRQTEEGGATSMLKEGGTPAQHSGVPLARKSAQYKVVYLQALLLLTLVPGYPIWLTGVLILPLLASTDRSDANILAYNIAPNLGYAATGVIYQVYQDNVWFLLVTPCLGMLVSTAGAHFYKASTAKSVKALWALLAVATLVDCTAGEGVGYTRAIGTYCLNATATAGGGEGGCEDDCYGGECGREAETAYAWVGGMVWTAVKGATAEVAFLPVLALATRRINDEEGRARGGGEEDRGEQDNNALINRQSQDASDVYKYTISYTLTVDVGNVISDLLTPLYISQLCAAMGGTEETVNPVDYIAWGLVGMMAYKIAVCCWGYYRAWAYDKMGERGRVEVTTGKETKGGRKEEEEEAGLMVG